MVKKFRLYEMSVSGRTCRPRVEITYRRVGFEKNITSHVISNSMPAQRSWYLGEEAFILIMERIYDKNHLKFEFYV